MNGGSTILIKPATTGYYVQYGAGLCAPDGWLNFDASPRLKLERLPFAGFAVGRLFPANVRYGNIINGLPVPDSTAIGVYASHVLEHLSRADFDTAISNTFRIMAHGGRFRLIVPDLEGRARRYIEALRSNPIANDEFMRSTQLGMEQRPNSLRKRARMLIGNSEHLWMWDAPSIMAALKSAGFAEVRRCEFGDSGDPMFDMVEARSRFKDGDITECAVECLKP